MTSKRISKITEQNTKYRGSCIQSNRLVSLIKDIVASKIILFAIIFNNGDPYRSSVQKDFKLYCEISKPGISEIWSRRSQRISSYNGQCRRKCSLSSFAVPQMQKGLKQSKLCLNLCSFSALNCKRSLVKYLTPITS